MNRRERRSLGQRGPWNMSTATVSSEEEALIRLYLESSIMMAVGHYRSGVLDAGWSYVRGTCLHSALPCERIRRDLMPVPFPLKEGLSVLAEGHQLALSVYDSLAGESVTGTRRSVSPNATDIAVVCVLCDGSSYAFNMAFLPTQGAA